MDDQPKGGGKTLPWWSLVVLVALATFETGRCDGTLKSRCFESRRGPSVYNYTLKDIHERQTISLQQYEGKVLLFVVSAAFCGETSQLLTLNALYHRYSNLEVIATPCNQFGLQEPGANATEILNSLKYVRPGNGFEASFKFFQKVDVNGKNEHPVYTFLKSRCPPPMKEFNIKEQLFYAPLHMNDIRWNFEKFLVNCRGEPVARYSYSYLPENMVDDIEILLSEC